MQSSKIHFDSDLLVSPLKIKTSPNFYCIDIAWLITQVTSPWRRAKYCELQMVQPFR